MNPRWMIRMARWAHRPPSERRVVLVLAVIAACLVLAGLEWLWGWPEWLTMPERPRLR
ncbi:MAG: hypothetical protein H5U20_02775 [Rhodobacteraceae bacterium]|nr:hypothetical protein [Paracoccaceae bacterium]